MRRSITTLVICLVAVIASVLGAAILARQVPHSRIAALFEGPSQPAGGSDDLVPFALGGSYTLLDSNQTPVTPASFPGRWRLVYFGYTTCPDICPTTLQAIAGALVALGPLADRLVPLFITIDPARDSPAVLAGYTRLFDRRIIGLTGTQTQISAAERVFRVYAARAPQPGTQTYLMDHTSFVYLVDPQGKLRALFGKDITASALAMQIRQALS